MNNILSFNAIVLIVIISYIFQCASTVEVSSVSTLEKKINYTDSLLNIGNYDIAKLELKKILDNNKDKEIIAHAKFNLAVMNIYFDNPFADYDVALKEFKQFVSEFPNHKKVSTAKNWIKILTVLRGFSREYKGSTETLTTIKEKCDEYLKQYSILRNSYQRCDSDKDSLKQQIQVLERVIEEITKSQE